jgi:polar amino acid transport system substrate-binding protein
LALRPVFAAPIRVVTEHLPPYQIAEDNQLIGGVSYLIVNEVLKRAGVDVNHEVMPWARAYRIARSGKNTIIYSITRSAEREPYFHWIGQLHKLEYRFYSARSAQNITLQSPEDALNYTVVSVRNSFEANSLESQGFEEGRNLILMVDYESAWQMLLKGRAQLTYANGPVKDYYQQHASEFEARTDVVESYGLYLAVSLATDKTTVQRLIAAFESVRQDPAFSELFNIHSVPR